MVVSAIGKEFDGDSKVTDLLYRHFFGDESAWQRICNKFLRLVTVNGICIDAEKLLYQAKQQSKISLPHCLSLGEELTAKIAAKYLDAPYLDAEKLVRFNCGKLNVKKTMTEMKSAFCGLKTGVMGGFYGGCENGRAVLSRGGGDVSGALCAVATNSVIYENYTDVNGVCNADPKVVWGAKTIPHLSYCQMFLLSRCGAVVLHPDAVKIAQSCGLPICVVNSCNPCAPSTLVSNCPSASPFLAVTERRQKGGIYSTVLHSMAAYEVFCRLERLTGLINATVKNCMVTQNLVQIESDVSVLKQLFAVFNG